MSNSTKSVSNLDLCPLGSINPTKSPQSPPSSNDFLRENCTREYQSQERVQIVENMVKKLLEQVNHLETQLQYEPARVTALQSHVDRWEPYLLDLGTTIEHMAAMDWN
ncbi:hypothetical protein BDV12DRAFT_201380 [Aspergillus spectabilis]